MGRSGAVGCLPLHTLLGGPYRTRAGGASGKWGGRRRLAACAWQACQHALGNVLRIIACILAPGVLCPVYWCCWLARMGGDRCC